MPAPALQDGCELWMSRGSHPRGQAMAYGIGDSKRNYPGDPDLIA